MPGGEIMNGRPQGGRAEQFGAGDGPPVPDTAGAVPRRGVEAGGDPASGGLLDSAFLAVSSNRRVRAIAGRQIAAQGRAAVKKS